MEEGRIVLSDTHHSTSTADYIIFQISTTNQTDNIKQNKIYYFFYEKPSDVSPKIRSGVRTESDREIETPF